MLGRAGASLKGRWVVAFLQPCCLWLGYHFRLPLCACIRAAYWTQRYGGVLRVVLEQRCGILLGQASKTSQK